MDWSKAKTILIISFIIVNVLLGLALMNDKYEAETTVSEDFVQDSIRLLANKNISVDTELPREIPSLESLIVEYETYDISYLKEKFFQGEGEVSRLGEGLVEISDENKRLSILNDKHLIYTANSSNKAYDIDDEDEAVDLSKELLVDLGFDISDMVLSHVKRVDNIYHLEFSKVFKERFLESAFTNIQLDDTGIKKLERLWLNVIEIGEIPIFISSAPKSILGLLSMKEVYGKNIKDISLCYYFDPEKHDYIQNPLQAKQGRAIPAWRIQFDDGYKVFIDNY